METQQTYPETLSATIVFTQFRNENSMMEPGPQRESPERDHLPNLHYLTLRITVTLYVPQIKIQIFFKNTHTHTHTQKSKINEQKLKRKNKTGQTFKSNKYQRIK